MGVFRMRSHAPTASAKNVRFSSMRVACAGPRRVHAQRNADDNRCKRTTAVFVMAQL